MPVPSSWTTTDDRLRGGASQSYLDALPNNCARFYGHLDTSTLDGAGFASQYSPEGGSWDLSAYDGIEVEFQERDGKVYTLVLKDEESPGKREDGREKASINWEAEFRGCNSVGEEGDGNGFTKVWVPWGDFKATYRGKEKKDTGELKTRSVRRVGIMMRSYFGKQDGDFSIELSSICARKEAEGDKKCSASLLVGEMPGKEENKGWSEWLFGPLYRFLTDGMP